MESGPRLGVDKVQVLIRLPRVKATEVHDIDVDNAAVFDAGMQFVHSCVGTVMPRAHWWKSKKARMTFGWTPYGGGATLCVAYGWSAQAQYHFLRVEFNPSKLGPLAAAYLLGDLSQFLPHGYQSLYQAGSYSRLELFIDVDNARWGDYLYFDRRLSKVDDAFESDGTLYLGTRMGHRSFCIYDKAKELLQTTGELLGFGRVRMEARLLHSNTFMPALGEIQNPFLTLSIVQKDKLSAINWSYIAAQFRQRVFEEGMQPQAAYAMCSDKPGLLRALRIATPSWYDPAAIWSQFPSIAGSMEPSAVEAFAHQIHGADLSVTN